MDVLKSVIVLMSTHEPRNVLSYELVLLICTHMGSQNKFSFVAQTATLGNFFNLHKSKMNSGRHFDNFTFELLVLECCLIPLFWGSKVRRIHLCCYFFKSRSCSGSNEKYWSIINENYY